MTRNPSQNQRAPDAGPGPATSSARVSGEALFDDPRITAIGLFCETHAALTARLAAQHGAHGLSAIEFEVLVRLARSPDHRLRMTDLAAQTALSTSGATRVVDRMVRSGLIARHSCPEDRRISYALVTESGMARLTETLPGHLDLIEQLFTGRFAPDQLDQLLRALRTVRDALRPEAVAGADPARAWPASPDAVPAPPP